MDSLDQYDGNDTEDDEGEMSNAVEEVIAHMIDVYNFEDHTDKDDKEACFSHSASVNDDDPSPSFIFHLHSQQCLLLARIHHQHTNYPLR